jgi:hypothetical protein
MLRALSHWSPPTLVVFYSARETGVEKREYLLPKQRGIDLDRLCAGLAKNSRRLSALN